MSATPQKLKFDLADKGVKSKSARTLASSFNGPASASLDEVSVQPFGAWIAELQ
jgi:hypothetical protein